MATSYPNAYQNGEMAQGNSYAQQGTQDYQQAQQSYGQQPQQSYNGQQSEGLTEREGHNYNQRANHAMNGNGNINGNQGQNHSPNEMNGNQEMNGNGYQGQGQGYQQSNYQTSGMNGYAGQSGAKYPDSKAPDTMHIWLDRIEKKFGGERFDETKHPENAAKNKALNENIIKKLKQVMQIVIQRGPSMAMQYGSKLF